MSLYVTHLLSHLQEDYGANRLYPLLYILRNVCAPALASLFVQNFKDTKYVKDQKYEEIAKMNLYELLRKVHNKGKKEEEKKKKKQTDNLQSSSAVSKTLHINNLGTNADILSRISVRDLLVERPKQLEIKGDLSNIDVTFLLNVLTNEILEFDLDLRPLQVIRSIRNKIFHSGSEIECTEISLNKLCEAAEKVHKYIGEAVDIHSKREESLSLPQCLDTLACNIIGQYKLTVLFVSLLHCLSSFENHLNIIDISFSFFFYSFFLFLLPCMCCFFHYPMRILQTR